MVIQGFFIKFYYLIFNIKLGMDGMNFGGDFGGGAGINIDDIFRMFSGGGSSNIIKGF